MTAISCHCCAAPSMLQKDKWSSHCTDCKQLLLGPATEQYRYVEAQCEPQLTKTIYRLKHNSIWFTCSCHGYEHTVDLTVSRDFGRETVFASTRTNTLTEQERERLQKLEKKLKDVRAAGEELQQLEYEGRESDRYVEEVRKEEKRLEAELEKSDIARALNNAENKLEGLKQEIASLRTELSSCPSAPHAFERDIIETLKTELQQVKRDLKTNETFNKKNNEEYKYLCTQLPLLQTENELKRSRVDVLESKLVELTTRIETIEPAYAQKLRECNILEDTTKFAKLLAEKEQKNDILTQWLKKSLGKVESLCKDFSAVKEDAEEKWSAVVAMVQKEQDELNAAEDRRKENTAQRLEFVEKNDRSFYPHEETFEDIA